MNDNLINIDTEIKSDAIQKSIEWLDLGLKLNPEKISLYFYRGLLLFYLH